MKSEKRIDRQQSQRRGQSSEVHYYLEVAEKEDAVKETGKELPVKQEEDVTKA